MDNLKEFTFHYINTHDKLSLDEKKQIWEFVKTASENQVINLLLTGKMNEEDNAVRENINLLEEASNIAAQVDAAVLKQMIAAIFGKGAMYQIPILGQGPQIGAGVTLVGGILAAVLITLSYQTFKIIFSKAERKCIKLEGIQKEACRVGVKLHAKKEQLKKLQQSLAICEKTKKSDKCKAKLNAKIGKVKTEINTIQNALKGLK